MPQLLVIIFIIVGIMGLIVLILHQESQAKARRKELAILAKKIGFTFNPLRRRRFHRNFPRLSFLRLGLDQCAYNILKGKLRGHSVYIFDYEWYVPTGKSNVQMNSTFILMNPIYPMQPFVLRPEYVTDRVADFFGFEDIDFESAEFSSKFHVSSPNRRWTFDFFHGPMIEYVMKNNIGNIICNGRTIALDPSFGTLNTRQIERRLERLVNLVELTPSQLRKDKAS